MKTTLLTHHDLDGYGAAAVVRAFRPVERIVHVARYADVGPVVEGLLARLTRARDPEALMMTDLGLEAVAVTFLRGFAAMNAKRDADKRHNLLVLDHHASSLQQLAAQGVTPPTEADPAWPGLQRFVVGSEAGVVVLIDDSRCATRLARDHHDLYATRAPDAADAATLGVLVEAIDAVDLWRKDRPIFRPALVLDEVFWDNVSGFVPTEHPLHEDFMGRLLLGMAGRLGGGASPAAIESEAGTLRATIIDAMLAGEPGDDPSLTTRMRLAPMLARSPALFHRLGNGAKLSFGLDAGTFQRVSDAIMASGDAALVINAQRSGSLSFRSNNETALDAARLFRGGGHKDAAGGRLSAPLASMADAVAQLEPVLNPPKPAPSSSPFAALAALKG